MGTLPNEKLELDILATVVYFDIFEYPLTLIEIFMCLLDCESLQSFFSFKIKDLAQSKYYDLDFFEEYIANSDFLNQRLSLKNGFFFLKNKDHLVELRLEKDKISQEKFKKARKIIKILRYCPFLRLVFVTSSVALNNASQQSDIDLLLVTAKNRIWTARLYCLLFLKLFNLRPKENNKKDKICVNFLVSEEKLCLEGVVLRKEEKNIDLHFAYWLSQCVLIYSDKKDNEEFYNQNIWLKNFFPNYSFYRTNNTRMVENSFGFIKSFFEKLHFNGIGDLLEKFYEKIQMKLMPKEILMRANKNTNVILNKTILKFHVNDKRREYLIKFLNNFKILLGQKILPQNSLEEKKETFLTEQKKNSINLFDKFLIFFLCVFIFFAPWQTRLIYYQGDLNGFWEQGTGSLYFSEIILLAIIFLYFFKKAKSFFSLQTINTIKTKNLNNKLVIVFFVLVLCSLLFSISFITSIFFLIHFSEAVVLYFILNEYKERKKFFLWGFILSLIMPAVLGIYQFLSQQSFANKWLGLALHQAFSLGSIVVENSVERWCRAYSVFPHPNIFAAYLAGGILILFFLFMTTKKTWQRIFFLANFCLFSFALFFSFSKAAFLSLFVCLLVYGFTIAKNKRKDFLFLCAVFFTINAVLAGLFFNLVDTRIKGSERLEKKSYTQRLEQFKEAKDIFIKNPLGVGVGNYTYAINNQIDKNRQAWDYQPVHNIYILTLVELGGFIIIIYALFLYYLFKKKEAFVLMLKDSGESFALICIIFVLILGFFDHFFLSFYSGQILLFFLLSFF